MFFSFFVTCDNFFYFYNSHEDIKWIEKTLNATRISYLKYLEHDKIAKNMFFVMCDIKVFSFFNHQKPIFILIHIFQDK
jgi:hypothetical protein